jgi:hypothetical protein
VTLLRKAASKERKAGSRKPFSLLGRSSWCRWCRRNVTGLHPPSPIPHERAACHRPPSDPSTPILPNGCRSFFVCAGLRPGTGCCRWPAATPSGSPPEPGSHFPGSPHRQTHDLTRGRAGVRTILYTVARTSGAQRFSSTAVYPPILRISAPQAGTISIQAYGTNGQACRFYRLVMP